MSERWNLNISYNSVAPCKDCKDRCINCHSSCCKYIEWKKIQDENNERIYQEKRVEHNIHVKQKIRVRASSK